MQLIEVNSPETIRAFHKVPFLIYKNNPTWIPHLKQDVEKIFDRKKNKAFRGGGDIIRWILKDANGKLIGRVAAFVNPKYKGFKQPTGGMGYFECIDNREAAFLMLDACKNWLEAKGMQAMDGPINFGEKNEYWGLLIENFKDAPTYQINYNPEYYRAFFEAYGFRIYYEQYLYWRNLLAPAQEIFVRKAEVLMKDPKFTIRTVRGMSDREMAQHFIDVYNNAWTKHDGFKPMVLEQAVKIMKAMKPVKDPDITIFVFYDNVPIAFYVNLPELNQIFRYANGNLNLWGKLMFLWHKWRKTPTTMYGIVFGVVKEWQGRGVEGAMIKFAETDMATLGRYTDTILTWIGDFNLKMIKVCENLGATKYRTLATYRFLFDREAPFERAPYIGSKKGITHGTDASASTAENPDEA